MDIKFEELVGHEGNLGVITLNRPDALNALTMAMCQQIGEKLDEYAERDDIKAVVICGKGGRAFCAGGDVRKVHEMGIERAKASREFFWHEYRTNRAIFHFPKPYVALLNGITMGGGVGVSIHGSHPVAGDNILFSMPETGIGFFPDVGGTYFLSRLSPAMGLFLGLTGAQLNAADVMHLGLVDNVVNHQDFNQVIEKLLASACSSHVEVSESIQICQIDPGESQLAMREALIEECFSADNVEHIIENLKACEEKWCQKQAEHLLKKSPTSLSVTFAAIQKAASLEFDDVMRMEYRLASHFLENHDFYEGVRAALIDKNNHPKWQPAKLDNVKDIKSYFSPVTPGLVF